MITGEKAPVDAATDALGVVARRYLRKFHGMAHYGLNIEIRGENIASANVLVKRSIPKLFRSSHLLSVPNNLRAALRGIASMECAVSIASRDQIPVSECRPSEIIYAFKDLRRSFGIQESSVCGACTKRSRCKFYLSEVGEVHPKGGDREPDSVSVRGKSLMYALFGVYQQFLTVVRAERAINVNDLSESEKDRLGSTPNALERLPYDETQIESCFESLEYLLDFTKQRARSRARAVREEHSGADVAAEDVVSKAASFQSLKPQLYSRRERTMRKTYERIVKGMPEWMQSQVKPHIDALVWRECYGQGKAVRRNVQQSAHANESDNSSEDESQEMDASEDDEWEEEIDSQLDSLDLKGTSGHNHDRRFSDAESVSLSRVKRLLETERRFRAFESKRVASKSSLAEPPFLSPDTPGLEFHGGYAVGLPRRLSEESLRSLNDMGMSVLRKRS